MSAWDRIDLATNWQPAPNFLYDRVEFLKGEYRKIIYHRIDQSFGYLLRNITVAFPTFVHHLAGVFYADGATGQSPEIEFYVRRQSRQSGPVPFDVLTSPCEDGYNDQNMFPALNAVALKSFVFLNYFFQFGDTMEIHIVRNPNVLDSLGTAAYAYKMQIVSKGYDVPEPQSRIW
jgi:hypothetical protein